MKRYPKAIWWTNYSFGDYKWDYKLLCILIRISRISWQYITNCSLRPSLGESEYFRPLRVEFLRFKQTSVFSGKDK